MTVKSFNTYRYIPFTYSIHKPHYWYVDRTVTPTADYAETINLEKFKLSGVEFEKDLMKIPSQPLWDYTSYEDQGTLFMGFSSDFTYFVKDDDKSWSVYPSVNGVFTWENSKDQDYTIWQDTEGALWFKRDGVDYDSNGWKYLGDVTIPAHESSIYKDATGVKQVGNLLYEGVSEPNIVTGFNLNNYLVIPKEAFDKAGDDWEMCIRAHFVRRGNYYHMLLHTVADNKDLIYINNYAPGIWGTRDVSRGTISSDDDFVFILRRLAGKYFFYVGDGSKVLNVTGLSDWNLKEDFMNFAVLTADHDFSQGVMFGAGTTSNRYWNDSIDLSQCMLYKLDTTTKTKKTVWNYETCDWDNPAKSDENTSDFYPTDQWATGSYGLYLDKNWALVGFSNSTDKVIQTNYQYSFTNGDTNVWQCHFRTPTTTPTTRGDLMYANTRDTLGSCLYLIANTQVPEFKMPKANLTLTSKESLQLDTEYYVRVTLTSSLFFAGKAVMELSNDGQNWRTVAYQGNEQLEVDWPATGPVNYSDETNTTNLYLGLSTYTTGNYFRGGIYPDGTFITVNGVKRWAMTK